MKIKKYTKRHIKGGIWPFTNTSSSKKKSLNVDDFFDSMNDSDFLPVTHSNNLPLSDESKGVTTHVDYDRLQEKEKEALKKDRDRTLYNEDYIEKLKEDANDIREDETGESNSQLKSNLEELGVSLTQKLTPNNFLFNIVVSHQSRIVCFLNSLILTQEPSPELPKVSYRFQNGAIIWIELSAILESNGKEIVVIDISLKYSGELTTDNKDYLEDKQYYSTSPKEDNEKYNSAPDTFTFRGNKQKFNKFKKRTIYLDGGKYSGIFNSVKKNGMVLALVRHGEALHNVAKKQKIGVGFLKVKTGAKIYTGEENLAKFGNTYTNEVEDKGTDTVLTETGIKQAIKTGAFLSEYLIRTLQTFPLLEYYNAFASDLKRSQQTLLLILFKINSEDLFNEYRKFILPCSHEISSKNKSGINCDGSTNAKHIDISDENKSIINIPSLNSNGWNTNEYEAYNRANKERKHCSNTNMLNLILLILHQAQKSHIPYEEVSEPIPYNALFSSSLDDIYKIEEEKKEERLIVDNEIVPESMNDEEKENSDDLQSQNEAKNGQILHEANSPNIKDMLSQEEIDLKGAERIISEMKKKAAYNLKEVQSRPLTSDELRQSEGIAKSHKVYNQLFESNHEPSQNNLTIPTSKPTPSFFSKVKSTFGFGGKIKKSKKNKKSKRKKSKKARRSIKKSKRKTRKH